jgi:arylsulfatase B
MHRNSHAFLALLCLVSFGSSCAKNSPALERPNIVIIVADDMGWGDVGFHGSPISTPGIDRLALEGMVLDRFYVFPVCSPTRAGLMTGRYPIRFGLMKAAIPPHRNFSMDEEEVIIPQVLAKAGYKHRGIFGKWHLGHTHIKYTPTRRGFTEFVGHYNGAIDYFSHERDGELDWHRNEESNYDEGYATDLIADAASRFIRKHANDGPFFCYVPFNAPHSPFQAKDEDIDRYRSLPELPANTSNNQFRPTYAAMVDCMDQGISRILQALDEAGIADNTLVWFFSDNGGTSYAGDNRPLRGGKGEVFEGGTRVPSVVRWPDKVPAGTKSEARLAVVDVLPTLIELSGVTQPLGKSLDGISAVDILTGKRTQTDRDVFNYTGSRGEEHEQISLTTSESWKLVVQGPNIINQNLNDSHRRKFLFRIDQDPNETRDLAHEFPERVSSMYQRLLEFRALQPHNAIAPYVEPTPGFKAPREWKVPGYQFQEK